MGNHRYLKPNRKAGSWSVFLVFLAILLLQSVFSPSVPALAGPLWAADPSVTVGGSSPFIGEDFSFTVTFENTGTDPGYGPFIDLVFPYTGEDGDDGVDFLSASYLGSPLEDDVQIFPYHVSGIGCVSHPWLRDDTGAFVDVCGPTGDKFVSLRLPFGSYVPGQPALDITVNASLSINADVSAPLSIFYRGGYMYGETPLDDWCCGDEPFAVPSSTDSGIWPNAPVTPQLFTFTKSYGGPGNLQDETATGPNFPRTYTLTLDLAEGQTLSTITVYDQLPDNLQFIQILSTSQAPISSTLPSTTEPGGTLEMLFGAMTSPADNPLEIVVEFYIPEFYDGPDVDTDLDDPVISPTTGDDVNSDNIAWAEGYWNTIDDDDPDRWVNSDPTCPGCAPLHSLEDKSIAIQKSVAVVPGTGGGAGFDQTAPGAVLEYTLDIQVSDYFSFDDLVVTDLISDGQHLLPSGTYVPTLRVNGNTYTLGETPFDSGSYTVTCDYTGATTTPPSECTATTSGGSGTTTVEFDLSTEILFRGEDGTLLGGCINPPPVGGVISPCDPANLNDGPTTASIVFRTQVLEEFIDDYPSGDISVDQGDTLENTVDVVGDVLDNSTFGVVGSEEDDAAAGTSIGREDLSKTVYAINNITNPALWDRDAFGNIRVKPGDKITFELTYDLLTSDVEELILDDYFPLPVFDVNDPDDDGSAGPSWTFNSSGALPDPGVVTLRLPGDTFYQYVSDGISGGTGVLSPSTHNPTAAQDPVIAADGPANKLNIYYADYDDIRNLSTTVDLLLSLVVTDDPFADGLFLTNMAHAYEGSTNAGDRVDNAILHFVLNEPVVSIQKGIIYSSNPNAVFNPVDAGPPGVSFLSPTDPSSPPRFTGTIHSDGLALNPIDSNLEGIDAGDRITFAILVENQGSSLKGAFDIQLQDIIDTDYYLVPADGADLNLQIYYGDRSGPISYRSVELSGPNPVCTASTNGSDCGLELFQEGIELIDPQETNPSLGGVCSAYDPLLGNNVILLTYDLEVRPDVNPGQALNTVTLVNYAGSEGGPNHLPEGQEDDATADVLADLEKTLIGTEIVSLTNADDEAVIGEIITYKLSAIVPEGEVPDARLVDQLDEGLAYVGCDAGVSPNPLVSAGISTDFGAGSTTDFSGVCAITAASGVTNSGRTVVFDFGDLVNSDRVDTTEERIEITYQVVVLNIDSNQNTLPTLLNNGAEFLMNPGSGDVVLASSQADEVAVIEPQLGVSKTALPNTGDYGDTISYTIDLSYDPASDTTAYDIQLVDQVPADMAYVGGSLICTPGGGLAAPDTCSESGGIITVEWLGAGKPFESGYSATITFNATIDLSVTPGDVISNDADLSWTSLPGDEAAPRSTHNALSVERTGDTTGPGGATNDYQVTGTADVTVFSPRANKTITGTNLAFTAGNDVTIGEQISYRSNFIIPEGTSTSAQLIDTLDAGLAFVSCDLVYVTETIPGSLATTTAFDCASAVFQDFPDSNPDNQGRRMVLDLGVVTNSDMNNATDESLTVEYTVVVINGGSNDRGDAKNNSATWTWSGGSISDSAPNATIVEPGLEVVKTALPTTGDYGDTIQFTIDLAHAAGSNVTAFDVVLEDIIPGEMTYVGGTLACATSGGLALPDTCAESGGTISVEWLGASNPFETPGSAQIIFEVTLDLEVEPSEVITNDASVTWTSLPGDGSAAQSSYNPLSVERTGDTGDVGGAENDYEHTGGADVTIFSPTGNKDVISTNQAFTSGLDVAIGEQVTYQADFVIPEGTSTTARLIDTLEQGLAFVSCDSIVLTETIPGSLSTTTAFDCSQAAISDHPDSSPANQGRRMTIDLGVVTNSDTNNSTDESITVVYTAVVLNTIGNNRGADPTNSAAWTWSEGSTTISAPELNIVEPTLQVIKDAFPLSGDAGDVVTFTVQLSHPVSSDSDAYEVNFSDTLPAGLTYQAGSVSCTPFGGLSVPAVCSESGGTITASWSGIAQPFETGHSAQIQFQAVIDDTVHPTEVISNQGDLDWTSLPGDVTAAQTGNNPLSAERTGDSTGVGGAANDYLASDDADVTVPNLILAKSASPTAYAIGETIIFDLLVTLPEGETRGLVVDDSLPAGLSYVSHSILAGSFAGDLNPSPVETITAGSGGALRLEFGDTDTYSNNNPGDNSFAVRIQALVMNLAGNVDGLTLQNTGVLEHEDGPDITDTQDISIIEPLLVLSKTVDDDTPQLGQTLLYTIQIAHDQDMSGEDSHADAYDLQLDDLLPTGLKNIANLAVTSTGNCASGIDTSGSDASHLDISIAELPYQVPAPGCVVEISFEATVNSPPDANTPAPDDDIENTADLTWTSTSGANPDERIGDGIAGGLNDYETGASREVTITQAELRISKTDGVGVNTYTPGNPVVYTILVENIGNGDVVDALVEDNLPTEVNPPNDPMVSTWDWECIGATGSASGCTESFGLAGDFSDLVNLPAGSSITYQVTANILSSAEGDLENTVTVSMPAGIIEPTPDDNTDTDIDSQDSYADLTVTKDDGVTIIAPGQVITYTVVVSNGNPSDVVGAIVEDLIPLEIDSWTWDCGAVPPTGGATGCDGVVDSAADFTDTVNLPVGSSITYQVTAQISSSASGSLTNTATIDTPPEVEDTNPADNSATDIDSFPMHSKTLDSALYNAVTLPDVAIGEVLTYEIVLIVPPGSMTNTHLVDNLDRGLAFRQCLSIAPSAAGLNTTAAGGFTGVCGSPTVSELPANSGEAEDQGRQVDFFFDELENTSGGNINLIVRYQVVVLDSLANQSDSTPPLNNQAEWVWDSGDLVAQATAVTILEPDLIVSKDAYPTSIYPGQVTTFTLVVEHTGESQTSGYDVELTDIIPAGLIYQAPIRHISGQIPSDVIDTGDPTLVIRWAEFLNDGTDSVIEIDVMLDPNFNQRNYVQTFTNEASLAWTSLPGDVSAPQSVHNVLSTERYYDPLSDINIYNVVDSVRIRVPRLPDTGFAPGEVTDIPDQTPEQGYENMGGMRLEIPSLSVDQAIVSVPLTDDGYDLSWLWENAGWLEGTAYPSWTGNTVITGHAYLPSGLPGPFVDLSRLSWGDEIVLYVHGMKHTYQVQEKVLVSRDDLSILGHKDQDWLTLFTCQEYNDELGGYRWRQVVGAALVKVEEAR